MIPVEWYEILSSRDPSSVYKLYLVITCEKFHSGKAESFLYPRDFDFGGANFFHVIVSAHLSGMKKDVNKSKKYHVKNSPNLSGKNLIWHMV